MLEGLSVDPLLPWSDYIQKLVKYENEKGRPSRRPALFYQVRDLVRRLPEDFIIQYDRTAERGNPETHQCSRNLPERSILCPIGYNLSDGV